MNKRIDLIRAKNQEWAKESPYNYCDRFCERCPLNIKETCRLYLDQIDREATNIAHGRDPQDLEILEEDMEDLEEKIEQALSEQGEDLTLEMSAEEETQILNEMETIDQKTHTHDLMKVVHQYYLKAREYLIDIRYAEKVFPAETAYHLTTIAWYHSLVSAKMNRALTGFYEADIAHLYDFALHDAVAQLDICRKAVTESLQAFRYLCASDTVSDSVEKYLMALLHHIQDQILLVEQDIEEKPHFSP